MPTARPATLRVATDTRSIEPGDAFLALRGDNFDGHAYTAKPSRAALRR